MSPVTITVISALAIILLFIAGLLALLGMSDAGRRAGKWGRNG